MLLQKKKKRALQFWMAWNIICLLVEMALIIVFIASAGFKVHRNSRYSSRYTSGRARYSNDEGDGLEKAQQTLTVWGLIIAIYFIVYMFAIVYMCLYYNVIKKKEDTATTATADISS